MGISHLARNAVLVFTSSKIDASSSATVKDTHVFDFSASPSNAPTLSDSGTDGKTYRVYKTVSEARDAAAKNLYYVQKWTLIRVERRGIRSVPFPGMLESWRMQKRHTPNTPNLKNEVLKHPGGPRTIFTFYWDELRC